MFPQWLLGVGKLVVPSYVDCSTHTVAVSEDVSRVTVFEYHNGALRAQFGGMGAGAGQLNGNCGLCLLR